MRVLWTHNFDPRINNTGTFMNIMAEGVRNVGIDLELCYLGNLRSVKNLLRARRLVKHIAGDFDLIHAQFGSACAVATMGAKNVPRILSLRGSDWYWYKEKCNYHMMHGLLATMMSRKAIKSYNLIITMSNRMTREVTRHRPFGGVVTLPSPVDLESFRPLDKGAARARLGFAGDTTKWVLFTTLSTKNPVKRVPLAIEAVNRARNGMGGITLKIATGLSHEEMPLFVGACDLVLCTSVYEGWPNCIKEALACNIPFVSTDVSDLSLIADQDPSCRICAPDPDILADNICDVLCTQSTESLRHHVAQMDVSVVGKKLVELYMATLSKPRTFEYR